MKRFGLLIAAVVMVSLVPNAVSAAPISQLTKPSGELTISSAASLTDAFNALAAQFRKDNTGVKVRLNFGSSSTLVSQIQSGAPSDLIASADLSNIEKLVASGNVVVAP